MPYLFEDYLRVKRQPMQLAIAVCRLITQPEFTLSLAQGFKYIACAGPGIDNVAPV
jgi:hypothetical protein